MLKIAIYVLMLIAFFGLMVGIGFMCRRKSNSTEGFLLGGRNVGAWLTAFAYGTSYFSAVVFIGYAGQFGYKFGIASTWIGIGNAVIGSLLAWVVLGRRTRIMTHRLNAKTMPEFFEQRYDSKNLKLIAAIVIFIFLIPYTASLYNGLSRLFEIAFNIPFWVCVIIMATLTAVYVIAGGYMATAINDFIQGIIMLFGIVAVIVAVIMSHGGWNEIFTQLSQVPNPSNPEQLGVFTSFFGPDVISLTFVVILTSLGTWGLPQMVQKFYAIKDESAIKKGIVISTVFALIVAGGCYFLGGFARLYTEEFIAAGNNYDAIVPAMLSKLSPVIIGLVLVLVLSASMSTLSSLALASSSTVTIDLVKPTVRKNMGDKEQVYWMRILIVFFVAISALIAILQYYKGFSFIAQMMGVSWGALAGAFLAPFLYGLYFKKTSKPAVYFSIVFGVGAMVAYLVYKFAGWSFLPPVLSSPLNLGSIVMILNLILVPVISLFTRPKDMDRVEKIFECYNQVSQIPAKEVLVDLDKKGE